MRISARAEYACLAMIELARPGDRNGSPKRVREIAEAQGIPERYLLQILIQLKAAGLVQSVRGADGGYQLRRSPDVVTIAEVISVFQADEDPPRRRESPAALRLVDTLQKAREAERVVLASTTIAHLVTYATPHDWVL